ncbi:MAG TPA: heavy-metal-associated domain-containing protein [Chitinophagaceae bacterium]|nr:heavy-metal-associated domain-containing protein [Chitinophagaceae bacterium]
MKKLLIVSILALLFTASNAQFTRATLQASGLTCAMCSRAIDNALKELPYIETVKPDIRNSAFTVTFKQGQQPDIDGIKKAVEDAGFFVAKFVITGTFNNTAIKNDDHIAIAGKEYHFLNVQDQVLNGEKSLTVVDKNFLSPNAFKKYTAATAMQCIKTGQAGGCCEKAGLSAGTRIYHVTI